MEMLLHKNEIDHGAQSNKDDYYYLMVANYYIIYNIWLSSLFNWSYNLWIAADYFYDVFYRKALIPS